jgi:hypothetical protein
MKEKTNVEVLSEISGVSEPKLRSIWQEVVENNKKLSECKGPHDFIPIKDGTAFKKFKCSICNGTISTSDKYWYDRGFKHGYDRGNI